MARVCVEGCWVPSALAAAFRSRENTPFREKPFSYSDSNPGGPNLHYRIHIPKVLPIVSAEEMSTQAVHLQYNSPMGLYNKETAQEQFEQQIGSTSPIPLPASDRHFDPNKSATLRYIKEGDHSNFGENFAQKIAAAEAPNVPYNQEPHWARYAREKSERARSRTPADPLQHRYSGSRSPSQPRREHHDTPWEHAEKNRTYTNQVHPSGQGPAYWQYQNQGHRHRGHSVGSSYPDKGYECGGMDFTKDLPIERGSSGYYETHVSRKEEHERPRPGYEMGGTDFGKGYVAPGPYHGHGPDPPRLRPRYNIDPHNACNSYVAPNVDGVDANLLVGDTLSNQKIRHEVRHIDQSEFGTSFAPPGGFKRDHITVRRTSPPPEPVIYSTNCASNYAKRSSSAPRSSAPAPQTWSSAPPEQQNVWRQRQQDSEREVQVYTTEPNWSRTVQQRRGAWERKAFDTEARVNLPASAKVPAQAPPAWHQTAQQKHQVWQDAADHVQGGQPQSYKSQQSHTTSQFSHPQPVNYSGSTNAMNVVNSGFNQNQLDYIASHQNNYQGGQQYSPRQHNTSYSTTTTTHFPGGYNQESHFRSERSQSETRSVSSLPATTHEEHTSKYSRHNEERTEQISPIVTQLANPVITKKENNLFENRSKSDSQGGRVHDIKLTNAPFSPAQSQQSYKEFTSQTEESRTFQPVVYENFKSSKYSRRSEETVEQISPGIKAGTFLPESQSSVFTSTEKSRTESKQETKPTQEGRVHPIQIISPQSQQSLKESFKSTTGETHSLVAPVQKEYQEQRSHYKSSSSTREERTIPVQTGYQESNYHKSSSQETRSIPVQPIQNQYQESYHKTTSSTQENNTAPLHPIQTNFQENYQKSSSSTTQETRNAPRYETGLLQTQGNLSNLQNQMLHSPGSYKSFHSSHYSKQETTTSSTGPDRNLAPQVTTTTPVVKNTSYSYSSQSVSNPPQPAQIQQSSTTNTTSREAAIPIGYTPLRSEGGSNYHAESHHSYRKEEQESRPVSQLSQYSQNSYNRKREERTETRTTVPTLAPLTHSSAAQNQAGAQTAYSKIEMNETLPRGSVANTQSNTKGGYRDQEGHDVFYKRDLQTTSDPGRDVSLLKEEEKRVVETPLEPGVISRHVTTKYYKKKTVTDTTTTTTPEVAP